MFYTSTRDKSVRVTAAEAIAKGISSEGGLFVPTEIPEISLEFIEKLVPMTYIERAKEVLRLYLTDFTEEELSMCVEGAYKAGKFSSDKVAPLYKLNDTANVLELWRGPTCAFKDMALQLLPYLLTVSASKTVKDTEIVILVATSGDTGKAALEGFADVPNTKILVFYPVDGVSPMQKLQMTTQEGANVSVCAIEGNFDDAQSGVKKIFTDKEIENKELQTASIIKIVLNDVAPIAVIFILGLVAIITFRSLFRGIVANAAAYAPQEENFEHYPSIKDELGDLADIETLPQLEAKLDPELERIKTDLNETILNDTAEATRLLISYIKD